MHAVWCKTCGEGTVQGMCRTRANPTCQFKRPPTFEELVAGYFDLVEGWDDGKGLVPDPDGLRWLIAQMARHWPVHVGLPLTEALASGKIRLSVEQPGEILVSADVDLVERRVLLTEDTTQGEHRGEWTFNLAHDRGWMAFIAQITGDVTAGRQLSLVL